MQAESAFTGRSRLACACLLAALTGCMSSKDKGTSPDTENPVSTLIPVVKVVAQRYDTTKGIVQVTWSSVKYAKLAEYLVYRGVPGIASSIFTPIGMSKDSTFTDTLFRPSLDNGKIVWADTQTRVYEYTVRVRNSDDEIGAASAGVSVKAVSPAIFDLLNRNRIPAVELAGVCDTSGGNFILSWRKPNYPEVKDYLIYRTTKGSAVSGSPYEIRTDTMLTDWIYRSEIKDGRIIYPDTGAKEFIYAVAVRSRTGEVGTRSADFPARCVSPLRVQTLMKIAVKGGTELSPYPYPYVTPFDTIRFIADYHNDARRNTRAIWSVRWWDWEGKYGEDTLRIDSLSDKSGSDMLIRSWTLPFPERSKASIIVRITDESGGISSDSAIVFFWEGKPKFISSMTVRSLYLGESVQLVASNRVEEVAGRIVKYEWDLGETGKFIAVSKGDTIVKAPNIPGDFKCILRVTDDDGMQATWGSPFPVLNYKAKAGITGLPSTTVPMQGKLYYQPSVSTGGPEVIEYDVETGIQTRFPAKGSGRLRASASRLYMVQTGSGVQEFNPSTGLWVAHGDLVKWIDSASFLQTNLTANLGRLNQNLYMVIEKEILGTAKMAGWVMQYNSGSGEWEKKTAFPGTGLLANNTVFLGNEIFAFTDAVYSYSPSSDSWTLRAALPLSISDYAFESVQDHEGRISMSARPKTSSGSNSIQYVMDLVPATNQITLMKAPSEGLHKYAWYGERLFGMIIVPLPGGGRELPSVNLQLVEWDQTPAWARKFPINLPSLISGSGTPFGYWNGYFYVNVPGESNVLIGSETRKYPSTTIYEYKLYD